MCIRIVERYAVCHCIYHQHSVDPCGMYGQHAVEERTILVGYACPNHGGERASYSAPYHSSSSYNSSNHSSRGSRW